MLPVVFREARVWTSFGHSTEKGDRVEERTEVPTLSFSVPGTLSISVILMKETPKSSFY